MNPRFLDPVFDVVGVEADEVADLEVGDAAFGDEAADVALVDAEAVGDVFESDEWGSDGVLIRSQVRTRFRALLRPGQPLPPARRALLGRLGLLPPRAASAPGSNVVGYGCRRHRGFRRAATDSPQALQRLAECRLVRSP